MTSLGVVWHACGDRAPFLAVAMEWKKRSVLGDSLADHIFVDRHPTDFCFEEEYRIVADRNAASIHFFEHPHGRASWAVAIERAFAAYDYDYIISIEEDVVISNDFLALCRHLTERPTFLRDDILYFHAGAWEVSKGDMNVVGTGGVSSRALIISKDKFRRWVLPAFNQLQAPPNTNDEFLRAIVDRHKLWVMAANYNRHGHFGVYGFSVTGDGHAPDARERFFKNMSFEQMCETLRNSCLSRDKLRALNPEAQPEYFWDFDPNISFSPSSLRLYLPHRPMQWPPKLS